MTVEIKRTGDVINWDYARKELAYLNHYQVAIGFFGKRNDRLLTIVGANEYGATIRAKNKSGFLVIPTRNVPTGSDGYPMSVAEYRESHQDDEHKLFRYGHTLAIQGSGDKPTIIYILKQEVQIKSRPFIRNALAGNKGKYKNMILNGLTEIMYGRKTGKQLLEQLGGECQADIRTSAVKLRSPKNAPLTVENKKSDNPLVDSGSMIGHVTWQIIPKV